MTQNPFYWPANLPTSQTWPLSVEETVGFGGGGIGMNAGGPLPVGQLPSTSYAVAPAADGGLTGDGSTVPTGGIQPILRGVFVGGPNVIFGPHADWGDPTPTDLGFTAQPVVFPNQYAGTSSGSPKQLDLGLDYLQEASIPDIPVPAAVVLDLQTTKIMDSKNPGPTKYGYLADFFSLGQLGYPMDDPNSGQTHYLLKMDLSKAEAAYSTDLLSWVVNTAGAPQPALQQDAVAQVLHSLSSGVTKAYVLGLAGVDAQATSLLSQLATVLATQLVPALTSSSIVAAAPLASVFTQIANTAAFYAAEMNSPAP
jgi:hypothetical protein